MVIAEREPREARHHRGQQRVRANMAHSLRRHGKGDSYLSPVPIYAVTAALCATRARTVYCAARRAGLDEAGANAAYDAEYARLSAYIGQPTNIFFADAGA